jgi:hypothetical protein
MRISSGANARVNQSRLQRICLEPDGWRTEHATPSRSA